ncbi:unnamed protein product [Paramecium octaurelia]|uniref:Transmembrane protein n=1 Tax=Paramecium octaurelia TaxID=43137 RepID=A0A8S1W0Q9_PAROT|nr:unnamed protein product [Paramecium octaurelia]
MQTQSSFNIVNPDTLLSKDTQLKRQDRLRKAVIFALVLATCMSLLILFTPKSNYVPSYSLNQRNSYYAQDQLCVYQVSTQSTNCTLIEANTTSVTIDENDQNSTHILMLDGLQVSSYNNYSNGTVIFSNLYETNVNITGKLNNALRILEKTSDPCNNQDCGSYNEIPMVTYTLDKANGQVLRLQVPNGLDGLLLQTLISSIQHLGPNVESSERTEEGIKNPVQIGKYQFMSEREVDWTWFGYSTITKEVTEQDSLDNDFLVGDHFKQKQTTKINRNNEIVESQISVDIEIDHSVQLNNQDKQYQIKSSITDNSTLKRGQSYQDAYFTNLLKQINNNQDLTSYTAITIQDRLLKQYEKKQLNIQELKKKAFHNRLLTQSQLFQNQSIHCPSNGLIDYSSTIVTFSVKGTNLSLDVSFKGTAGNGNAQVTLKFCLALEGFCVFDLVDTSLSYTGQPLQNLDINGIQNISLLQTALVVQGFVVNVGADFSYGFIVKQNVTQTSSIAGFSDTFIGAAYLTVYGDSLVPNVVQARAAVLADIFTGNLTSSIAFGYNPKIHSINSNSYTLNLNLDMEEFRAYAIAQVQHSELSSKKKCKRHLGVVKVCYQVPTVGLMGDWITLYKNNWGFHDLVQNYTLYGFQSQCFLNQN